jgi:hypothetical protein
MLIEVTSKIINFKSIHEYMRGHEQELLELLDAHALILFEQDYDVRVVYGDSTMMMTRNGYDSLMKQCKFNTVFSLIDFTTGLAAPGAGIVFYKINQYKTVAIMRRAHVADVMWAGVPDPVHDQGTVCRGYTCVNIC